MRRILSFILIFFGIFLMSCAPDGGYSRDMQYGEFDFFGECTVNGCVYTGRFYISAGETLRDRERSISISSPDSLTEMKIFSSGDGYVIECDGISVQTRSAAPAEVFSLFDIPSHAVIRREGERIVALADGKTFVTELKNGEICSITKTDGTETVSIKIIESYD